MEANPYAIGLSDDDEYAVKKPASRGAPPPPRSVVPVNSSSSLTENPHAISLGGTSDYPSGSTGSGADEYGQTTMAPRDKKTEGKMTMKVCTAKLIMCAVAIGFLWLTTFAVARSFVDAIISSDVTPAQALQSWNATMHSAQMIKGDFELCVDTKNGVCLSELNASTLNELQRGIDIQRESEATIGAAQARLAKCQEKVTLKHQALKRWMNELSKAGKTWSTTSQCPQGSDSYADFIKIADGNTTENADAQARSLTQQYQAALKQLADQTRDAFSARVAYNSQWANNHTAGLIDALSLNATKITVPNFTLAGAFAYLTPSDLDGLKSIKDTLGPSMNNTWNALVVQYANAKLKAELIKNQTQQLQLDYQAAYVNMSNYVDKTSVWLADAKATLSRFGSGCGYNLPAVDIVPPNIPGFPAIGDLNMNGFNLSTTQFDVNLDNKLAAYKAAAQQKADTANAQIKAYFENLDTKPSWYSCIACDYNPPPLLFPTSDEQDQKDSNFNAQLNGLLTSLGDAATSAQVGASKLSNDTFELPSLEFIQAQRSKADLQFAALGGDVDFTNILAGFASISTLILALDYVYRGFRSASLLVRYWFGSAVGLPDIKINKQKSAEVKEPIGVRIMTFITSPAFVLLIVGIIIFGLLYVLLDLYVPAVNEYVAGCQDAGFDGPGTLISRNAYSLVFNNAVGTGQKNIQSNLNDYDTLRQSICGQYVTQTGNTQQQLQAMLDATHTAYDQAYNDLQLISTCTDVSTNNYNFNTQTNTAGLNFNDATAMLIPFTTTQGVQSGRWDESNVSCTQNELANFNYLADMTFVCQNVSLCTQMGTCVSSVDTVTLKQGAWDSSCKSERVVLIGITAAGLSVLVYVLWNLGRMLLIMGLGRMYWKHLVPHGFNYIATCTTDGRIPRDIEKEVTTKLRSVINTFERWGVVYLATAVLLQLAWIIPVAVLAKEINTI